MSVVEFSKIDFKKKRERVFFKSITGNNSQLCVFKLEKNEITDHSHPMIQYLFRKPRFPVICNIDGCLVGARSGQDLQNQLDAMELRDGAHFPLVDSSAEGWALVAEYMVISPIVADKRWTKRKVIGLFNQSNNAKELGVAYSERGLSAKRFDRIMSEIVHILLNPNGPHTLR